jgi:hypothetical protein
MADDVQIMQELAAMQIQLSQMEQKVMALEVAPVDNDVLNALDELAQEQGDMGLWQDTFNAADKIKVEDGAHILEGAGDPVLTRTPKPYHFQVIREPGVHTSVRVRGGRWTRTANSVQTTVTMSLDSGTAGSQDSYKTLTGFNGISTTYWVYMDIDDNITPTTLVANKATTTYPASDTTNTRRVLAKVITGPDIGDGTGIIASIEQIYHGGDVDDWWHQAISPVATNATLADGVVFASMDYDAYGHVTAYTTKDLDSRYAESVDTYTKTEIDTMLTDGTVLWTNLGDTQGDPQTDPEFYIPMTYDDGGGQYLVLLNPATWTLPVMKTTTRYDCGAGTGQTVGSYFTGGILTGSATTKLVSDLDPTDRVLVF